jgi:hypothetical protein
MMDELDKSKAYYYGMRDKQEQYYPANPKNPYDSKSKRESWVAYNQGFNSNPTREVQGRLFDAV